MTQQDIPEGYWRDAKGALVPLDSIKPEHQEEDALVRALAQKAKTLNAALADLKSEALGEVQAFRELISEKYGAKRGGQKGNVKLSTFDGSINLQVAVSDHISFGTELEAAKALIDECIHRWSEGANANLRALIDSAFQVDKQGKISTSRVLGLRRLNIDDPEWGRAMDAISDAVRVTGSKTYIRFYHQDAKGELVPLSLDIASA